MKDFTLKEEAVLRKFLQRSINCGHAVFKNTANLLNVKLPSFSTMVGTADLYNNNKLFFECFEELSKLAKLALANLEDEKEVNSLEASKEDLKLRLQSLYKLEHEEKMVVNQTAKASAKADVIINEIELSELRKIKREKKEELELYRMQFQKSLRKRFEI